MLTVGCVGPCWATKALSIMVAIRKDNPKSSWVSEDTCVKMRRRNIAGGLVCSAGKEAKTATIAFIFKGVVS